MTFLKAIYAWGLIGHSRQVRGSRKEKSRTCLTKKIFVRLYSVLVRPHLEKAIQANCLYLKMDIYHLERIQQAATSWVKGLRDLNYEEKPRALKLQSLEKEG